MPNADDSIKAFELFDLWFGARGFQVSCMTDDQVSRLATQADCANSRSGIGQGLTSMDGILHSTEGGRVLQIAVLQKSVPDRAASIRYEITETQRSISPKEDLNESGGMTLRRYYAGRAMFGLLASGGIANAVDAEAYATESQGAGDFEGAMGRMA